MRPNKSENNERGYDQLEAAADLIEKSESFVITTHTRPDPDAIGSALALARGLRQLGKHAVVISQDGVPEICLYLPDSKSVITTTEERGFDVGVICDANEIERVGSVKEIIDSAKKLLVVDHHLIEERSVRGKKAVCLVESRFAATAELVMELLGRICVRMDADMARQLLAGIVGDTGALRFPNVKPSTLLAVIGLIGHGASLPEAVREIYENRSIKNTRLVGVALSNVDTDIGGRLVWSCITKEDFARLSATDADTDSIVNQLMMTKGAEAALLFRETGPGVVRVSLRSRGGVDVNEISKKFGGGGHAAAAGCTMESGLKEACDALLAEVRECMAS